MAALYEMETFVMNRVPIRVINHHIKAGEVYTPPHWHRNIEITLTETGRIRSFVNGHEVIQKPGDWNIINTAVIHSGYSADADDDFTGTTLQLSKGFVDTWLGNDTRFRVPAVQSSGYDQIRTLLQKFGRLEREGHGYVVTGYVAPEKAAARELQHPSSAGVGSKSYEEIQEQLNREDPEVRIRLKKMELSFALLRLLYTYCLDPESPSSSSERQSDVLKDILNYMEAHYKENVTLADVAAQFHYSEEHLSRKFRQYTGTSFHVYLENLRITSAVEDLREHPDRNLSECAMDHGFPNVKSFINAFKRSFGCTPSQWVKTATAKIRSQSDEEKEIRS